ncbi:MAG: molybdate ABC transporter permease subunit [Myxococcota bacterium]
MDFSPLIISLQTSVAATVVTLVVGLAAAWRMQRVRSVWRGVLDSVLMLPLVLPPTVVGFLLLWLLGRQSAVGRVLYELDASPVFSVGGAIIAAAVVAFPLMYKTALGALEQVDESLLHAARTLGASEWRVFRRISIPLAWPGILAGVVLAFARALGEFGATLMLAGNIPGKTQTIPVAIFFFSEAGDTTLAATWVGIMVLISVVMMLLANHLGTARLVVATHAQPKPHPAPLDVDVPMRVHLHPAAPPAPGATLDLRVLRRRGTFRLDVALQHAGSGLGLLGPSGAGKSMTLRCLAGIEPVDEGRIVVGGRTLLDTAAGINVPARERRVGVVFQDYALFPHLTVRQNVAFGLHGQPASVVEARVLELLREVQLEELAERRPDELSGGQRQRVALARALAPRPDALLLDEPFAALDWHLRHQMQTALLSTLASYHGVTVLVTHDVDEAYRLCPALAVMVRGQVAAQGPRAEVLHHPRTVDVARVTGCKNISRAEPLPDGRVRAVDWNCELPLREPASHVGVRANHIRLGDDGDGAFRAWPVLVTEAPHRVTVFLHLHAPPSGDGRYHLQVELTHDRWQTLRERPAPWPVHLPSERLLALS